MGVVNWSMPEPIAAAVRIAMGYFAARGYTSHETKRRTLEVIAKQVARGERRPMVLANEAIKAFEQDEQAERQIEDALKVVRDKSQR
jgi:hypothetical protein